MATQQQKKKWLRVGIMMAAGFVIGMVTLIKHQDISNGWVWTGSIIGFGSFAAGFILLLGGTKG